MISLNEQAPAAKAVPTDSSHWYSHTPEWGWRPLYTPEKNYTLREARKAKEAGECVVPSVTTYFKCLHKQQLLDWKIEQAIRYADANPRGATLIEEWIDSVTSKADSARRPAADLGTAIHAAVELAIADKPYDAAMDVYVQAVLAERAKLGIKSLGVETCCGSKSFGYGGKCDEHAEGMLIVDLKSRKSKRTATGKLSKVTSYSTDKMQTAAYGYALFGDEFFTKGAGIVLGISTTEPGLVTPHIFMGDELLEAFDAFRGLIKIFAFENNFSPYY